MSVLPIATPVIALGFSIFVFAERPKGYLPEDP